MNNKLSFPYYAVIFTSLRADDKDNSYDEMADKMTALAKTQDCFLGLETARNEIGITISYWRDIKGIQGWKRHSEHLIAQKTGKKKWYKYYKVRVAKVEREYDFRQDRP